MSDFDPKTTTAVVIEPGRVMCGVHGSPFRAELPKGYAIFAIEMIREALADKNIIAEAKRLHNRGDEPAEPKDIERVLDLKPACCRLPSVVLIRVYEKSRVGVIDRCDVCRRKRSGTPIDAENVTYRHCCFACIAGASSVPWGVQ